MKESAILCCLNTLKEEDCFAFLRPLAEKDVRDIFASNCDADAMAAPSAVKDMEDLLIERLQILYAGALISRLIRQVKKYDIMQAVCPLPEPTKELRSAARDLKSELENGKDPCLLCEYPLLSQYLQRIRENYKNHMQELLSRFHVHRQEIGERFFCGRKPELFTGFASSGADMHRKGRCVVHVFTDAGDCFYKPHDCGLDVFYREITRKWFSDCTMAPEVIRGEGYAFVSTLVRKELALSEVAAYYTHFGILTALLHGIGSNDIHGENVIPCGDLPCIVDMESVVSTGKRSSILSEEDSQKKEKQFPGSNTSVFHVGLLPARLHKAGMVSPLYHCEASVSALPFYGENCYTIEGYEADFLRGFREGYRRMLAHREEILEQLLSCKDVLVRVIPFNTVYYARCRARLFSEEALRSEQITQKLLHDLSISFTYYGKEANEAQIAYEASALQEGDIPYFCTSLFSHDLYAMSLQELVQKDFLHFSALEYTKRSLERLSEQELLFEEEILKRSFQHAPIDVPVSPEELQWPAVVNAPVFPEDKLIPKILDQIIEDRLYTADHKVFWVSHAGTVRNPAGVLAYLAGVILYSCRILSLPKYRICSETACKLLLESLTDMETPLQRLLRFHVQVLKMQLSAGIGDGLGQSLYSLGMVMTLPLAAGDTGNRVVLAKQTAGELRDLLIDHLTEKKIWEIDRADALEGLAGLLLGILAGEPLSCGDYADPRHTSAGRMLAERCAERLLQHPDMEEADAFNGDAGIGCALAIAFACFRKEVYAKGAEDAFCRVKERYSEEKKGWLESSRSMQWAAKRAPKAAGIGLSALKALKALNTTEIPCIREVLALSVDSLLSEDTLYWNDSLYRGNALSVLFLAKAGAYLNRPDLLERAAQVYASMEMRREISGYYHLMEQGVRSCFDVSFLEGALGIGYAAMELYIHRENTEKRTG